MTKQISDIRKDYSLNSLDEKHVDENAIMQFDRWFNEAINSEIDEVNAMTLATVSADGKPHARIVLLKGFDAKGFVFFTNYNSNKGKNLAENTNAALVFFWKELQRQVRIEGVAAKVSAQESDEYFFSRPEGSRIGAWASPQSEIIESRHLLDEKVAEYSAAFGNDIPRPPHWGGYRLKPAVIEFWQGRTNRLHDRIRYLKLENNNWKIERLAP